MISNSAYLGSIDTLGTVPTGKWPLELTIWLAACLSMAADSYLGTELVPLLSLAITPSKNSNRQYPMTQVSNLLHLWPIKTSLSSGSVLIQGRHR
jgi:uncharacterized OsmC-like protein